MKIYISEKLGTAYWKENNEIRFCPLNIDGTFDTIQGGIVETWDEISVEDRNLVEKSIR